MPPLNDGRDRKLSRAEWAQAGVQLLFIDLCRPIDIDTDLYRSIG